VTTLRIKSWLRGNFTGVFGALLVFGRRIKGMIRLRSKQGWTCNVTRPHRPLLSPSGSLTNWEPHGITLAGYCYAMRHGMKVQIVTPNRVSHLQPYGVTVRGNVTSLYPPLDYQILELKSILFSLIFSGQTSKPYVEIGHKLSSRKFN
jgi:hypothetical protein